MENLVCKHPDCDNTFELVTRKGHKLREFCCNDCRVTYFAKKLKTDTKQQRAEATKSYRKKFKPVNVPKTTSDKNTPIILANIISIPKTRRSLLTRMLRNIGSDVKLEGKKTVVTLNQIELVVNHYNKLLADDYHHPYIECRANYIDVFKKADKYLRGEL